MAKIIGIDLGTTNSCVSIMEGDSAKVIEFNDQMIEDIQEKLADSHGYKFKDRVIRPAMVIVSKK